MILARPHLEQPVLCDGPVAVGGGTIPADAGWFQVIHAPHRLLQGPLNGVPARLVAQGLQPGGQPVVADLYPMPRRPGALPQRVESRFRPGFDVVQPMVGFGEDVGQPEPAHPAQAKADPVTVGGKRLVQQGWHPYALQLGQQPGDIIDTFRGEGQVLSQGSRSLRLEPRIRPPLYPSMEVSAVGS